MVRDGRERPISASSSTREITSKMANLHDWQVSSGWKLSRGSGTLVPLLMGLSVLLGVPSRSWLVSKSICPQTQEVAVGYKGNWHSLTSAAFYWSQSQSFDSMGRVSKNLGPCFKTVTINVSLLCFKFSSASLYYFI